MEKIEKYLFGNFFEFKRFSTYQLSVFAQDTLNRFNYFNDHHEYDAIIQCLKAALDRLQLEINFLEMDLGLSIGEKLNTTQFIKLFEKTMMVKEKEIALEVGGYNSPAYFEFYPFGLPEYKKIRSVDIPILIHRIYTVANANSHQLSPDLMKTLVAFKRFWESNLNGQLQSFDVSLNLKKQTRVDVEMALLMSIHWVALNFPGNMEYCNSFFDFKLLYKKGYSSKKGTIKDIG